MGTLIDCKRDDVYGNCNWEVNEFKAAIGKFVEEYDIWNNNEITNDGTLTDDEKAEFANQAAANIVIKLAQITSYTDMDLSALLLRVELLCAKNNGCS